MKETSKTARCPCLSMMPCVYLFHSAGKQRVWNVVLRNTKAAMQQFSLERGCCNARDLAAAAAVEGYCSEVPQQRLGEDALWHIIARRDLCLSDWHLLTAIAAHCRSSALPLAQWALHVDFARMAPHQVLFSTPLASRASAGSICRAP